MVLEGQPQASGTFSLLELAASKSVCVPLEGRSWFSTAPWQVPGGGNGNPLQYPYLENPRDGGAWWAAVYGVTPSRTRLKRLSSTQVPRVFKTSQASLSSQHQTPALKCPVLT